MSAIIVVDADSKSNRAICEILTVAGHNVSSASSGNEYLNLLANKQSDVILSDVELPDLSSITIISECRKRHHHSRVVFMTSQPSIDDAVSLMRLGAVDYLVKPIQESHLLRAVAIATHWTDPAPVASRSPVESSSAETPAQLLEDWRVRVVLDITQQHFRDRQLRLGVIARELQLSPEHLCRLVKRETRESLRTHLCRARLREAMRLLRDTNLNVKEIAHESGFRGTASMDRTFKKYCGQLPTKYRTAAKQ
jgi:two-component system, response regulator YesN